jgi:hypothetical protein
VRPGFSVFPQAGGAIQDVFAWPIIDLAPGTSYDIEVTVNSGAATNVKTLTHITRALPAPAGAPNKIIAAGSSSAAIQTAFNNLNPRDVIQFENGTYKVNKLTISRSGTLTRPIYIRGASRTDTVLQRTTSSILSLTTGRIIIENMTLQGSVTDGGLSSPHTGVSLNVAGTTKNTLFRNLASAKRGSRIRLRFSAAPTGGCRTITSRFRTRGRR